MTDPIRSLPFLAALALVGCGPTQPDPDAAFDVTVTGLETDCTTETQGFQEDYTYNLFFDGSATELHIGTDYFASGTLSGCTIEYESPVWLEERSGGSLRWQITGEAKANMSGGGCDVGDDTGGATHDWFGSEAIRVVESDDESVPVGCTYLFEVAGTLQGG